MLSRAIHTIISYFAESGQNGNTMSTSQTVSDVLVSSTSPDTPIIEPNNNITLFTSKEDESMHNGSTHIDTSNSNNKFNWDVPADRPKRPLKRKTPTMDPLIHARKTERKKLAQQEITVKYIELYLEAKESGFTGSKAAYTETTEYFALVREHQLKDEREYKHRVDERYIYKDVVTPVKSFEDKWIRQLRERIEAPVSDLKLLLELEKKENELSSAIDALRYAEENKKDNTDNFPELPDGANEIITSILTSGSPKDVVIDHFNMYVSKADLRTLSPGTWVNDLVINYYGLLVQERSVKYCENFFTVKLKVGYASVRRWTKKFDLFSKSFIIFPVHLGVHWCCARINFVRKRIEYYDSLHGNNDSLFALLRQYLDDEHRDKKGLPFDFTGWTNYCPKDIPAQMNGFDCGVFTCINIDYLMRDLPFDYTQTHMPYYRKKLIYEISQAKLLINT